MLAAAALQVAALALLALAVPRLSCARWPARAPVLALVLWQAGGLAVGLLAVEVALTCALAPYGRNHADAVAALLRGARPAPGSLLLGLLAVLLLARLVQVLVSAGARTARERGRHRRLVDLVATRNPLLRGASVVGSDLPVAYCLPGLRPRVVVSSGALRTLTGAEVDAVLAHEQAHLDQRHDLVVLPFVALGAALPPARRVAAPVGLLVELLADDQAARRHDRLALARALYKVGSAGVPAGGLPISGGAVLERADRLLHPPPRLPGPVAAAVLGAATLVAVLPAVGLLLPLALAR